MTGLIQALSAQGAVEVPHGEHVSAEPINDTVSGEWFIDKGIPGQGPRPEWLDSKYESMADKAKAHNELVKRMGSMGSAPESYDFGDYADYFDPAHQAVGELVSKAKNHRISQEGFKDVVSSVVNYYKSFEPDLNTEMAKLGDNAAMRIGTIKNWAQNHLSEKSLQTLKTIDDTADVIEMMDELRQLHVSTASKIPGGTAPVQKFSKLTLKELDAEMELNFARFEKDENYRRELLAKREQILGPG